MTQLSVRLWQGFKIRASVFEKWHICVEEDRSVVQENNATRVLENLPSLLKDNKLQKKEECV